MKIAIGLILSHGFPVSPEFMFSFERMQEFLRTGQANQLLPDDRKITDLTILQNTSFPPDVARNQVVDNFLKTGFDYLFFADCDHVFRPDTIARLLAHDKPVISGRYHMRKPPYHPVAYVKHRFLEGEHCYAPVHFGQGVFEIERGGAGCLLIHKDVLLTIFGRHGHNWFRYQRGPEAPHDFTVSEDFWFFKVARELGFTCWLDWSVEAKHLQTMAIDRTFNEAYLNGQVDAMSRMTPAERQKVLDGFVACGFPEGFRLSSGDVVPPYTYSPGER